jgi:hypothetical protein
MYGCSQVYLGALREPRVVVLLEVVGVEVETMNYR